MLDASRGDFRGRFVPSPKWMEDLEKAGYLPSLVAIGVKMEAALELRVFARSKPMPFRPMSKYAR